MDERKRKHLQARAGWFRFLALLAAVFFLVPAAAFAEEGEERDVPEESEPVHLDDLVFERWQQGYVITGYTGEGGDVVVPATIEGEKVYAVASEAFQFEATIETIVLPNSIQAIGVDAFRGCTALRSVEWPTSLWGIGVRAFSGCTALRTVILPDGVGYVSRDAFTGCTALEQVTLPERMYDIGPLAFSGCTNLRVLEILGDPTSGALDASELPFAECENLEQIFYAGSEEDLLELVPAEQISWASTFLIDFNIIADSVTLEEYLGGAGDVAVPESVGAHPVRAFGAEVFNRVENIGRILYEGTQIQWDHVEKGADNEGVFERVCCLGSLEAEPLELSWEDDRITGASFASLNGRPLQGADIIRSGPDEPYTYLFLDLAGTRLRSFDLLTTGSQVERSYRYDSSQALVVLAGDVTGSGVLDITQLVRMAAAVTGDDGPEGVFLEAADLNGSGKVEITDLVLEAQWLAQYA